MRLRLMSRSRLAVAMSLSVAVLAWFRPSLEARVAPSAPMSGVAGGEEPSPGPSPRVFFRSPISAEAARVWIKLQQKVPMKFPKESPLEDVLNSIKQSTTDKEMPEGLTFYVDPVGLQEAEKTMASPITINLDGIRLETALKLALKQLGLVFQVHPDGLVLITAESSEDVASEPDASSLILNKLEQLQSEVAHLRTELGVRGKK